MKNLVRSELHLVTAELKETSSRMSKHVTQAAIFGALLALSVFPFIAFMIIGLGEILGGNYWLSSLIVGVVFAGVGGFFAYRAFQCLKLEDFSMPHTRETLLDEVQLVKNRVDGIKSTAKNSMNEGKVA